MAADSREFIAGSLLVGAMWWYSASVFFPVRMLKRLGIPMSSEIVGKPPPPFNGRGLGVFFSTRPRKLVLLRRRRNGEHPGQDFDPLAHLYADLVRPFSAPIFEEAMTVMSDYLPKDARVMDAGCGPGLELQEMASVVPRGEVVGVDVSAGMVKEAYDRARVNAIANCAFFQADVSRLPRLFYGKFDMVYSCLAHHHYQDPAGAAGSVIRCLRPGGTYCIIDPGPSWYNTLSSPLASLADPGWVGFHSPDEFRSLLENAGFRSTCWFELLPGFGIAVGQK